MTSRPRRRRRSEGDGHEQGRETASRHTDESAYVGDRKVFEYVTALARERGLAGATVLEALMGFGHSAHLHRKHVFESDRALVIEIVDVEDKLRRFAAELTAVSGIGLVTLEAVEILSGPTDFQDEELADG
jgi:PII-like signaling protein